MILPTDSHSQESTSPTGMPRRHMLSTLGLTGFGLLAASSAASAFTSKKTAVAPKVSIPTAGNRPNTHAIRFASVQDLPEEWTARNSAADAYLRYLKSLNLRSVSPQQVLESHAKAHGTVWNSLPPKTWWNRMGYVLKVVDRVAREMNVSEVEIISAYRSPAYNSRCAGAKSGSWHQANIAADVKFPVRASKVTATARELRDLGLFKGGVGGYWNFTHIDARGHNINW